MSPDHTGRSRYRYHPSERELLECIGYRRRSNAELIARASPRNNHLFPRQRRMPPGRIWQVRTPNNSDDGQGDNNQSGDEQSDNDQSDGDQSDDESTDQEYVHGPAERRFAEPPQLVFIGAGVIQANQAAQPVVDPARGRPVAMPNRPPPHTIPRLAEYEPERHTVPMRLEERNVRALNHHVMSPQAPPGPSWYQAQQQEAYRTPRYVPDTADLIRRIVPPRDTQGGPHRRQRYPSMDRDPSQAPSSRLWSRSRSR